MNNQSLRGVNPQQIELQLKQFEAEIEMQRAVLKGINEHGKAHRELVRQVLLVYRYGELDAALNAYMSSHQAEEAARRTVVELEIFKLEKKIEINKLMLEELNKPAIVTQ